MSPHTDQTRWFAEEVHVHEASLRSYVRGAFPAVHDVVVVQESYLRIWRARLAQPIVSSKAFLFTVARHVVNDLARRARRSPVHPASRRGQGEYCCIRD
ncbi:MAG: RNA polymerase sigma factor [Opitutaceae bacterium]